MRLGGKPFGPRSISNGMKIIIRPITFEVTPSFETYITTKFGSLDKLVKRFEDFGDTELSFEIRRSTGHHHKGDVFWAAADLRLPKKVLRAEQEGSDARALVDAIEDILRLEIAKYKTRFTELKKDKFSKG